MTTGSALLDQIVSDRHRRKAIFWPAQTKPVCAPPQNEPAQEDIHPPVKEVETEDVLRARLLGDYQPNGFPSIKTIMSAVTRYYDISMCDIVSMRRAQSLVRPRHIAMYLAKTLTPRPLSEIGKRFGGRDHTSVLHAVRKIAALVEFDPGLAEDLEVLTKMLAPEREREIHCWRCHRELAAEFFYFCFDCGEECWAYWGA